MGPGFQASGATRQMPAAGARWHARSRLLPLTLMGSISTDQPPLPCFPAGAGVCRAVRGGDPGPARLWRQRRAQGTAGLGRMPVHSLPRCPLVCTGAVTVATCASFHCALQSPFPRPQPPTPPPRMWAPTHWTSCVPTWPPSSPQPATPSATWWGGAGQPATVSVHIHKERSANTRRPPPNPHRASHCYRCRSATAGAARWPGTLRRCTPRWWSGWWCCAARTRPPSTTRSALTASRSTSRQGWKGAVAV